MTLSAEPSFSDLVRESAAARDQALPSTPFWDGLLVRLERRAGREEARPGPPREGEPARVPPPGPSAELAEQVAWAVDEIAAIRLGDLFGSIEAAAAGQSEAFSRLLEILDRDVKLRGILYRGGARPEDSYGDLSSKLWEALGKWDGRDFRAYSAQITRNFAIDLRRRRGSKPRSISLDQTDAADAQSDTAGERGGGFEHQVDVREALSLSFEVLGDLCRQGEVRPLDLAMFVLLRRGLGPVEIRDWLAETAWIDSLAAAIRAFHGGGELIVDTALAIRLLGDGVDPSRVVVLTELPAGSAELSLAEVETRPLREAGAGDDVDAELLAALCRPGARARDLERARDLSVNAVNLRLNRARLKLWMALVDRSCRLSPQALPRNETQLAIVHHRCKENVWCRMYKDHTCRMERDPADIAQRAGLDMDARAMAGELVAFRDEVMQSLRGVIPDYNACLAERRVTRRDAAVVDEGSFRDDG